jgi:hypothetical protein
MPPLFRDFPCCVHRHHLEPDNQSLDGISRSRNQRVALASIQSG